MYNLVDYALNLINVPLFKKKNHEICSAVDKHVVGAATNIYDLVTVSIGGTTKNGRIFISNVRSVS